MVRKYFYKAKLTFFIQQKMSQQELSHQAKDLVFKNNMTSFIIWETMDHDGYDEMGPCSNLWDLFVVDIKESEESTVVYHYHREFWYRGADQEPYQWLRQATLEQISIYQPCLLENIERMRLEHFVK